MAVQPGPLESATALNAAPAGGSQDWLEDTAAEQWRQDQCLMADVLRLGGPAMAQIAQDGLNQPQDKLHVLADRKRWEQTPLATAYQKDRNAASTSLTALNALRDTWKKPLEGLATPSGINNADFHWPPGSPGDGKQDFHTQTGLIKWTADRFWTSESDFYNDPTPKASASAVTAVKNLGAPLYGKDPDPQQVTGDAWIRAIAERDAYQHLTNWSSEPTGADNARLFLASGGFARTAPKAGTAEYRIAVEELKTRFASCAWRDPIDPDKVLGGITDTAAAEWQQEIASQAAQRNQVMDAGKDATRALTAGAEALGQMLGHSWVADHLTRWNDHWSAGGIGWIGDAGSNIELTDSTGTCLDSQGGARAGDNPVQLNLCKRTASQSWQIQGDDHGLHLRNADSSKCLTVAGTSSEFGTEIKAVTCNSGPAQTWAFSPRASTPLKHLASGQCLNIPTLVPGMAAVLRRCDGSTRQQVNIKPSGHTGAVQPQAHFTQAAKGIADAQAGAKQQLAVLKAQATAARTAATTSEAAVQAAYAIADKNGAPRGRGLLVGLQKAQVTKGAAAALDAMVKAGETAEAATRAAAGDSETIAQRALTQAAQSKAEFRKEAARTA
ncbi:RICIN domain-containing protein, partial [Streptomyces sp. NPDC057540]|uniref:RICIN domain-containing protein n=1 Tax=Streptomyces sp. NPDC057540 TaxID=3346160 RepID=UPI0036ACA7CF